MPTINKAVSRTTQKAEPPRKAALGYIGRPAVWPEFRPAFSVIANRLERPGTERIVFLGTLSRPQTNKSDAVPIRMILEHPNRLRLEEPNAKVTIYSGSSLTRPGSALTNADADEVETLLFDFPERLFVGVASGNGLTYIGSRFRSDDGSNPNYNGPYYDVYDMTEIVGISATPQAKTDEKELTTKRYFLNSDTLLMEKIVYHRQRGTRVTDIEVRFANWQKVGTQQIPFEITRFEEGKATLQLKTINVTLAKLANDGL